MRDTRPYFERKDLFLILMPSQLAATIFADDCVIRSLKYMPTIRAVTTILLKAGFVESKPVAPRNGQKAHNLSGFRVAPAVAERRMVFVYHVGRHTLPNLQKYAGALSEAGLFVTRRHGGLQVQSKRVITRRGLGH